MHTSEMKTCCHEMAKRTPSAPDQKDDCGQRGCNIILSCPACSFLTVDPIFVKPLIPIAIELQVIPYHMGSLSDYTLPNWNPPKV